MEEQSTAAHVAIIMDGNGRWARRRGLARTAGHRAGAEALKPIVRACPDLGIRYLTVYAFSTENWRRPPAEVQALLGLLDEFIDREAAVLKENGVCIRVLGDTAPLPAGLRAKIRQAEAETKANSRLTLGLCLNYGGRQEILRAARALAKRALAGEDPETWQEKDLAGELYTAGLPDPDLLIRTGGELRTSNFLPWQLVYTEMWSTDVYWPDFTVADLNRALADYARRQRRFGGV